MKKRSILWIALIAIAVIAGVLIVRRVQSRRAAATEGYETVAARRDTIVATVNASGTVMPKTKLTLVFPTGGSVYSIQAAVGQKVEAGTELARLDTRQLELAVIQAEATWKINAARLAQAKAGPSAADLAAAEAAVISAEALYDSAKTKLGLKSDQLFIAESDLKRAELALQDAQAAYDRVAWRPEIAMLPQAASLQRATMDYERALANYRLQVSAIDDSAFKSASSQLAQAKAQLDKLRSNPSAEEVAIAEAQVDQSKAALDSSRLRMADAILVAPFAGTVVSVEPQVGELVNAATPVVVLADLEHYYVDASIDEVDIGQLQLGQDVVITLDAFPESSLSGKVTYIDPLGKVVQGVVTYGIEVEIQSADTNIRPNMTATIDIVVTRKEDVLVVPNRAVRRGNAGRYSLQVLTSGKVEQRFVTVGLSNDTVTEITDGLQAGEEVIVSAPRTSILEQFGSGPFGFGGSR